MRWRLLALVGITMLAGTAIAGAATKEPRGPELVPPEAGHRIWICHATGNGFVRIEVDIDSIVTGKGGHPNHVSDIVPPFKYRLTPGEEPPRAYPGRNWDEGEVIWENGCSRPLPTDDKIEVFACVDVHNGIFSATFGYNSGGELKIPVGTSNFFAPGGQDRGQVTKFEKGYVLSAFTVSEIGGRRLTWTVKSGTHSESVTVTRRSVPCSAAPDEPETENGPAGPEPSPVTPIGVFVACVTNHRSTFDAVFGYDSQNLDSATVPIGIANRLSPGPKDRGQPTTFRPGHVREAFKVSGIPISVALRWTLAFTDTRMAIATADLDVKCATSPASPAPPAPGPRTIGVFATCATRHGSTYDATFGYVNENAHPLTIPIGARNSIRPGVADQGQPETFAPGFVDAAFVVQGIPVSRSVTWKLGYDHETRVAVATATLPSCLTAPSGPIVDVLLRKSATPRTAIVGELVKFRISLRNDGSGTLSPARVSDVLRGDRLRVRAAKATRGSCKIGASTGNAAVRCRAPERAPGASLTVEITTKALLAGTARDRATIVGLSDPSPQNNTATATVEVRPPTPSNGLG
jgi:hypothetical protein